eukprot:UN10991
MMKMIHIQVQIIIIKINKQILMCQINHQTRYQYYRSLIHMQIQLKYHPIHILRRII